MKKGITVYTILHTSADSDHAIFPNPEAVGSYLSFRRAQEKMAQMIVEEKGKLDARFDCEECGSGYWEMHQSGYDAACFSRFDLLTSQIKPHLTAAKEEAISL